MKIKYIRKIRQNFMALSRTENAVYEEKMLEGMRKNSLLRFELLQETGSMMFAYEITSLQPLVRAAEQRGISKRLLQNLILQLDEAMFEAEERMLSKDNLLLTPDTIYISMTDETVKFCLVPGGRFSFEAQMQELLLFLLRYIEPADEAAVLLCHSLFARVCRNEFEISDLTALVFSVRRPRMMLVTGREEMTGEKEAAETISMDTGRRLFPETERIQPEFDEAEKEGKDLIISDGKAEDSGRKKSARSRISLIQFLICFAIICAAPGLVVLVRGTEAVLRFLPVFGVADLCVILYFGVGFLEKRRHGEDDGEENETLYEYDMERCDDGTDPSGVLWREEHAETKDTGDAFETVKGAAEECSAQERYATGQLFEGDALAAAGIRRLAPLNKAFPQILLDHFPFVIGKSRIGTDGIIEDARVSRMHAKIQQIGREYFLTDLNSTNGTKLDGYLLNTNETLPLVPGQELSIAGIGYVFL